MKKKIFGFVVIALLSFATWQCIQQPLAPLLPNWDTQLSIPLVDTAYYMRDAFKNDSDFTTSPLGGKNIYQFKPPVYQFTPLFIGDTTYLQLNPTTTDTSIGQTLGNLDLGNGTTGLVTYNAAKLVAGSTPAHDVNTNQDTTYTFPSIDPTTTTEIDPVPSLNVFAIPETSVTYSYTIPPDTTLVSATLVNGSIQVTVINGLPFTDSLATVKVVNDLGDTIATFNMANIPGNGQTTTPPPVSLVGKHLTSGLTAIIYNTTSTAILPATFTPGAALTVEFNLNGPLLASTVVARLPPRVITDTVTQETVLDDSTYLDTATFKRGSIAITLNNTVDAGISFRFRFDQLIRNSDGAVFEDTTALGPKSDTTATFNLDNTPGGYHFVGATSTNALSYSLHIATLSINHPSVINSTDGLSIRVQLLNTPFLLHSLSGRLVPTVIPMNQGAKLGLPAGGSGFTADSIVADSAAMKLRFYTAAGHTTDFYLTMYAYRNGVFIPPTIPLAVPRFIPG
ncbi:MAG TPA: hypothetical protein VKS81_02665, partial [Bacteroidota bacterium]|nr:hypothetical protein [Bacteroidota bacterium]